MLMDCIGNYPLTVGIPMHYAIRHVNRITPKGYVVGAWEDCMARIYDQLLDCVIYIYPSERAARTGKQFGGSGFLVREGPHHFAVTCAHVISEGAYIVRLNTHEGRHEPVPLTKADWVCSDEDDLAVALIELPAEQFKYAAISTKFFMDRERILNPVCGPLNEVFLVGRFVNHEGRQRNLPCVRSGNISMMADDSEKVCIWKSEDGKRERLQEAFLVELRTKQGKSGSPVIIPDPSALEFGSHGDGVLDDSRSEDGPFLLGVHIGQLTDTDDDGVGYERKDTGMAIVIPAWRLRTLLDDRRVVMRKGKADERNASRKTQERVRLESLTPHTADDSISREEFEKTLKKVSRKRQSALRDEPPSESAQGSA
jgi:Trypsin-like peptidase domain